MLAVSFRTSFFALFVSAADREIFFLVKMICVIHSKLSKVIPILFREIMDGSNYRDLCSAINLCATFGMIENSYLSPWSLHNYWTQDLWVFHLRFMYGEGMWYLFVYFMLSNTVLCRENIFLYFLFVLQCMKTLFVDLVYQLIALLSSRQQRRNQQKIWLD